MESALYGIYALVVFVSEILLVRYAHSFDFWHVNNSCVTPALSMKYSLYIYLPTFILKSLKECKLMSASFFFIAIAKSAIVTIWLRVANFSYMKGKNPR